MGNSARLKATALVEAFNLRAAVELALGDPAGALGAGLAAPGAAPASAAGRAARGHTQPLHAVCQGLMCPKQSPC